MKATSPNPWSYQKATFEELGSPDRCKRDILSAEMIRDGVGEVFCRSGWGHTAGCPFRGVTLVTFGGPQEKDQGLEKSSDVKPISNVPCISPKRTAKKKKSEVENQKVHLEPFKLGPCWRRRLLRRHQGAKISQEKSQESKSLRPAVGLKPWRTNSRLFPVE